jgi:hypothetical protein
MKYWLLGVACAVYAVATTVMSHLSPPLGRALLTATYAFAGVASCVIALEYGRKDLLRSAWLLFGASFVVAFVSKIFVGELAPTFSPQRQAVWSAFVAVLNVGSVAAFWMFALVWKDSAMVPPWRRRATMLFFLAALAMNARGLYVYARDMIALTPAAFGEFIGVLGDVVSLTLAGPVFATAIALRGGLLMRPWMFLFAASVAWMIDDLTVVVPRPLVHDVDVLARSLAVLLGGAAALAQDWARRDIRAAMSE